MFKKLIKILLGEPEGYVSPVDISLAKIRERYPQKSASQIAEITKYRKIGKLRDGVKKPSNS